MDQNDKIAGSGLTYAGHSGNMPTFPCTRGEIGRHARFRFLCRKAWGFNSLRVHHPQKSPLYVGFLLFKRHCRRLCRASGTMWCRRPRLHGPASGVAPCRRSPGPRAGWTISVDRRFLKFSVSSPLQSDLFNRQSAVLSRILHRATAPGQHDPTSKAKGHAEVSTRVYPPNQDEGPDLIFIQKAGKLDGEIERIETTEQ